MTTFLMTINHACFCKFNFLKHYNCKKCIVKLPLKKSTCCSCHTALCVAVTESAMRISSHYLIKKNVLTFAKGVFRTTKYVPSLTAIDRSDERRGQCQMNSVIHDSAKSEKYIYII